MNRLRIRFSVVCIAVLAVLAFQLAGPASPALAYSYTLQSDDTAIEAALDFLRETQQNDGSIDGFATSAWAVMAIAAAGEDPDDWSTSAGNPSVVDYLRDNADLIESGKATDWERCILAITAAGEDPYDFGGIDYVSELEDLYDGDQIGYDDTLNDDFWGILALVSAGEDPDSSIIQHSVGCIKENQNEDGGWSWLIGDESESDNTAAAIMALIAAGESPESAAVVDGLSFLLDIQNSDGGFPRTYPGESNSSSDSWVIGALLAAGEDPTDAYWTPAGDNPVDHLLSLQDSGDGSFWWKEGDASTSRSWMTAYAIPVLLGEIYPVAIYDASSFEEMVIACTPSSLNFDAIEGEDDPEERTLEIWNSGSGTLDWTISDDADWLSVSPSSGSSSGERDEVSVSVDISGLDVDSYDATISISVQGAENSPRHITVNLDVEERSEDPVIGYSSSSISFTVVQEGDAAEEQILKIWNKGGGTLEWSVSSNADWLSLKPESGKSTGEKDEVALTVDTDGMETGDYEASITIRAADAANDPEKVKVSLNIGSELNFCRLSTAASPAGCGSVGVDISQPDGGYPVGTELTLTAIPVGGYVFNGWSGDINDSTNPVDITLYSDTNAVAHFVPLAGSQKPDATLLTAPPAVTAGLDGATKLAITIILTLILAIIFTLYKMRSKAY